MNLEDVTTTFTINVFDEFSGETFAGRFVVKNSLSPIEKIRVDRLYRNLIGSISPELASNNVKNLAYVLAQLNQKVIESPAFFKESSEIMGDQVPEKVLLVVFDKTIEAEDAYRERIKQQVEQVQINLAKMIKSGQIKAEDAKAEQSQEEDENA